MRVVFLDIDGVLNSTEWLHKNASTDLAEYPDDEWWAGALNPEQVDLLNMLVHTTDSVVVVSSTWRKGKTKERMQDILELRGFDGEVIGLTGNHPDGIRGLEIEDWLQAHPNVSSFVILDDDSDMAHLMPYLVNTDTNVGLTEEHVSEAQRLLLSGWTNVCEAIVAEAARELDDAYTQAQSNGEGLSYEEYELWEDAHSACYRAINMATFGVMDAAINAMFEDYSLKATT